MNIDPNSSKYVIDSRERFLEFANKWDMKIMNTYYRKQDHKIITYKEKKDHPGGPPYNKTITELAFIPDSLGDGSYFMMIEIPAMQLDAAPSRPFLFKFEEKL